MARRIGIYSGTFDPVHKGHIAFAHSAMRTTNLDEVVFMPEPSPYAKSSASSIEQRIVGLKESLDDDRCSIYRSKQPRFTVNETLPELIRSYPNAELYFLMGSDVALTIAAWQDVERLVERHKLVIGMRLGDDRREVEDVLDRLGATYVVIPSPHPAISSRQIRK